MGVVRHKLDVEGGSGRYDWCRSDVAAVLPQQVSCLRVPVVDLDVVVPGRGGDIEYTLQVHVGHKVTFDMSYIYTIL